MRNRITHAFSLLRSAGLYARQNFSCCRSCAGAELAERAGKEPPGKRPMGVVYFTTQDAEDIKGSCWNPKPSKWLYLAYGSLHVHGIEGAVGLPTADVGRLVCEAMKQAGIRTQWNGDADVRIKVRVEDCLALAEKPKAKREVSIVIAWTEETRVWDGCTHAADLGRSPGFVTKTEARAALWLRRGTGCDVAKAEAHARAEGLPDARVFTYPTSERDPLSAARRATLRQTGATS